MAPKTLLFALVLACAASSAYAIVGGACKCPATNVCQSDQGTCGLPPSVSISLALPGVNRAYGYLTKFSNVADAAACRAACGAGKYYEYVAAGGLSFGFFTRRAAKDCVCYSGCKNYAYWLSFPTVSIVSGFTSACAAPA